MAATLYNNLKKLVDTNEAFYISNQIDHDGSHYEIFLYRLASYTDFQEPDSIESRGIMFRDGICVSRPMEKFFNLGECSQWPEYADVNWEEYAQCMVKEDGSLISTWIDNSGNLRCKTKGSLHSDQAVMAEKYLEDYLRFKDELLLITESGFTVNMELVSPDNRIVLSYPETDLVILNIRDTATGKYLNTNVKEKIFESLSTIKGRWVKYVSDINMEDVPQMTAEDGTVIEGFVFEHPETGHKVKCKTDRYVELHHAKDDVNNPKRLLQCILEEGSDDLRSLFVDDTVVIDIIDSFEQIVFDKYNHIVSVVEKYYKDNKTSSQKEYAIRAKSVDNEVHKYFSLAMSMYNKKELRYKEFVIKNREYLFPDVVWKCKNS